MSNLSAEYLPSFLICAIQESNGYIREKAVRKWGNQLDVTAIPFLIDRLADWVPQVRVAAWEVVQNAMQPQYHSAFLTSLPSIDGLFRKENPEIVRIAESLMAFLFSQEFSSDIKQQLQHHGRNCWTIYVRRAIVGPFPPNPTFLAAVRRDPLIQVRSAPLHVLDQLSESTRDEILTDLLHDTAQPIRSRALFYVVKHIDRSGYNSHVIAAASDKSPSIRETARFYLRGQINDWAVFYWVQINVATLFDDLKTKRHNMLGRIGGLAEFATQDDLSLLEQLFFCEISNVPGMVLPAIYRLNPACVLDLLRERIDHINSRIWRCCLPILTTETKSVVAELVERLLHHASPRHRIFGLQLLKNRGGWNVATDLVLALLDTDPIVRNTACDYLKHWTQEIASKYWSKPEPEESERLCEAVRHVRSQNVKIETTPQILKTVLFFFGVREI